MRTASPATGDWPVFLIDLKNTLDLIQEMSGRLGNVFEFPRTFSETWPGESRRRSAKEETTTARSVCQPEASVARVAWNFSKTVLGGTAASHSCRVWGAVIFDFQVG